MKYCDFDETIIIFRSWLGRKFASLWRPLAPVRGPHRKPLQLRGFDLKVRFDGSIARLLDAGGWLGLIAGGWLMLSQLWWLLCMLVQKGCWLASMLCLGSHTLDALRGRRIRSFPGK